MSAKDLKGLAESFDLFDNWEDRYRYLIDLGQRLEPLDSRLKNENNLVRGCTSKVWLCPEIKDNEHGEACLYFRADSDAQLVKGLIYILSITYQGQPLDKINDIDIQGAFDRLGLSGHLSPNRRNGFFAMVEYIKTFASEKRL